MRRISVTHASHILTELVLKSGQHRHLDALLALGVNPGPAKVVGDYLSNGAFIIAIKEERDNVIILTLRRSDSTGDMEYVTYFMDGEGDCTCGHYFNHIKDAMTDWESRS